MQHLFATKSEDWKYEEEVRIIRQKNKGKIVFPKRILTEVIFGYKTHPEHMNLIANILQKHGYNVMFSQMKLRENDFGLEKNFFNALNPSAPAPPHSLYASSAGTCPPAVFS